MSKNEPYIDEDGEVRELDAAFFETAKRGRPPLPTEARKKSVHIMLDPDLLAAFKSQGKGWQTRLNATLRKAMGM